MTYEERCNAIGTLLRETILPRYQRPEHLDDGTARVELRDMVADLNAEWPLMSSDRFREVCERFARAVRTSHASRLWPSIAALVKALRLALKPPAVVTDADEAARQEAIYGMVRDWWIQFKGRMPSTGRIEHAIRLEREGLATWGRLRRAGFDLPDHGREAAMVEPDPNHDAIMADIMAMGERLRANTAPKGSIGGQNGTGIRKAAVPAYSRPINSRG